MVVRKPQMGGVDLRQPTDHLLVTDASPTSEFLDELGLSQPDTTAPAGTPPPSEPHQRVRERRAGKMTAPGM